MQSYGSEHDVVPPVFLLEAGVLDAGYGSLEELVRSVEGVDVDDGIYSVFDSEGRRIHLCAEGVRRGRFWVEIGAVRVVAIERLPAGAEELREALVASLSSLGVPEVESLDLASLVVLAMRPGQKR